ncbi:MAG: hypothetical protein ACPGWS_01780, partial [Solirubrobacterales bacterium]
MHKFLTDAGRIYLSPDGDAGGEPAADPTEPDAGGNPSQADDPKLASARDEAYKARQAKKAEKERADALERELAKVKARQADILKAAGLETDDDGGADLDAIQKKAEADRKKARDALVRAEAKTKALEANIRPDRVEKFLKLADLSGADVDLDTGEVTGVDAAIADAAKEVPEFMNNGKKPGIDTHHSGDPKGYQFDPKNVKPGDLTKFARQDPEGFKAFVDEGVEIRTGMQTIDADGNAVA